MASNNPSSQSFDFTEEQNAFLIYHLAAQMKPKLVYDSFNSQFSTIHGHSTLRRQATIERGSQSHYLSIAKNYKWYKPELRIITFEDEIEVDDLQQISPKKGTSDQNFCEEHRAYIATYIGRIVRFPDLLTSLNAQFSTNYTLALLKQYRTRVLDKNQEEEDRLLAVAKQYAWYTPLPSPSSKQGQIFARLQRKRLLKKKWDDEEGAKKEKWKEAVREDPEVVAKA